MWETTTSFFDWIGASDYRDAVTRPTFQPEIITHKKITGCVAVRITPYVCKSPDENRVLRLLRDDVIHVRTYLSAVADFLDGHNVQHGIGVLYRMWWRDLLTQWMPHSLYSVLLPKEGLKSALSSVPSDGRPELPPIMQGIDTLLPSFRLASVTGEDERLYMMLLRHLTLTGDDLPTDSFAMGCVLPVPVELWDERPDSAIRNIQSVWLQSMACSGATSTLMSIQRLLTGYCSCGATTADRITRQWASNERDTSAFTHKVLEGEALVEFYKSLESASSNSITPGLGSCMSGAEGDRAWIWGANPDIVKLVVVCKEGTAVARSLTWHKPDMPDGLVGYLDRIFYVSRYRNPEGVAVIEAYLRKAGYAPIDTVTGKPDKEFLAVLRVPKMDCRPPYADSFGHILPMSGGVVAVKRSKLNSSVAPELASFAFEAFSSYAKLSDLVQQPDALPASYVLSCAAGDPAPLHVLPVGQPPTSVIMALDGHTAGLTEPNTRVYVLPAAKEDSLLRLFDCIPEVEELFARIPWWYPHLMSETGYATPAFYHLLGDNRCLAVGQRGLCLDGGCGITGLHYCESTTNQPPIVAVPISVDGGPVEWVECAPLSTTGSITLRPSVSVNGRPHRHGLLYNQMLVPVAMVPPSATDARVRCLTPLKTWFSGPSDRIVPPNMDSRAKTALRSAASPTHVSDKVSWVGARATVAAREVGTLLTAPYSNTCALSPKAHITMSPGVYDVKSFVASAQTQRPAMRFVASHGAPRLRIQPIAMAADAPFVRLARQCESLCRGELLDPVQLPYGHGVCGTAPCEIPLEDSGLLGSGNRSAVGAGC